MVAGHKNDEPIAMRDRLLQRPVDRSPGALEAHSVKVDDAVGNDGPAAKAIVPAAVERCGRRIPSLDCLQGSPDGGSCNR